jgi:hypothetical protein
MAAVSKRCGHVGELGAKATPTSVICGHRVRARAVSRCCRLDFVEAGGVAIASSCLSC